MTNQRAGHRLLAGAATLLLTAGLTVALGAAPAAARTRTQVVASAAGYATAAGYHVGVAVLDTRSGRVYHGGSYRSTFASESVVKTMIAARLLLQGRMHGSTASRAYTMIIRSDDAIASSFYGSVGGDGLITWIKRHYDIPDLGSPPHRAGWWGNTHITAVGLVKFYAKVKKDRRVGPWLLNAMHHARAYGSDGTYQFFGLPSATTHAAVKQGWGIDYDDWGRSADFNTTGYVNGDRYAVAILARGPARTYGRAIGTMLTRTARILLPGGRFPDDSPAVTSLSATSGPVAGGRRVTIHGTNFTHVTRVRFGANPATGLTVLSSTTLQVTSPYHRPMLTHVVVETDHGRSPSTTGGYTYVPAPAVSRVAPTTVPTAGGTAVTVTGSAFTHVTAVSVDRVAVPFRVRGSTTLTLTAPAHGAGPADVVVRTAYGTSRAVTADRLTYVSPTGG